MLYSVYNCLDNCTGQWHKKKPSLFDKWRFKEKENVLPPIDEENDIKAIEKKRKIEDSIVTDKGTF